MKLTCNKCGERYQAKPGIGKETVCPACGNKVTFGGTGLRVADVTLFVLEIIPFAFLMLLWKPKGMEDTVLLLIRLGIAVAFVLLAIGLQSLLYRAFYKLAGRPPKAPKPPKKEKKKKLNL